MRPGSQLNIDCSSGPTPPHISSSTPHLRSVCQGIWSLVGNAVTKMVSTMSYNSTQPELFARSLRRRLQSLTPEREDAESSSPQENEEELQDWPESDVPDSIRIVAPLIDGREEERIHRLLDQGIRLKINPVFPLCGTTFPPNRFSNGDLLRARFRSESDLIPAEEDKNVSAETETPMEQTALQVDIGDSDLFFDFDIGSPDPPEFDDPPIINEIHEPVSEECLVQSPESDTEVSSNSPTLLDTRTSESPLHQSPSTTEPSTAYGSTSSGLYSDGEASDQTTEREEESGPDLLEGLSLLPEDWVKNQQALASTETQDKSPSTTPVMSPSNTQKMSEENNPDVSIEIPQVFVVENVDTESQEDSISDANTENQDAIRCETTDDANPIVTTQISTTSGTGTKNEDEPKVKICIGDTERPVAQSKLQALLAQLEKGSEFGSSDSENRVPRPQRVSTGLIVGSLETTSCSLGVKTNMGRCQSTLDMTDFDKSKVSRFSPKSEEVPIDMKYAAKAKSSVEDLSNVVEDEKKEKYRKCSSLKSGKTPPGTPARRKIVRFADVFGLDLADVKTFLDEVPTVPKSAFKDLKDAELSDMESDTGSELHFPVLPPTGPPAVPTYVPACAPTIAPLFNQPSGSLEFFNHLRDKKVSLESAYMSDSQTIKGVVRVVNLDYNKKVCVRYTVDDWKTTTDALGEYIVGSCDGFSDKFNFTLDYSPIAGQIGRRLQFCIRYDCASNEYWDNNFGKNYIFQCFGPPPSLVKTVPMATPATTHAAVRSTANAFATFSHSPSALNEDPWLRYL